MALSSHFISSITLMSLVISRTFAATIEECASGDCVLLSNLDISHLLEEAILTKHQAQYLRDHYSSTPHHPTQSESETADGNYVLHSEGASPPYADVSNDLTAYTVITSFLTTANLLYSIGCSILAISYLVLLFWFRHDSVKIQIALTTVGQLVKQ